MAEQRMVQCVKIGKELPGLNRPPRNDELGKRIYETVSAQPGNYGSTNKQLRLIITV